MTSQRVSRFREKILQEMAENRVEIKAIKKDTERIISRLDAMNNRVATSEKDLSFVKGVSTFMFAALSIIVGLLGVYR